MGQGLDCTRHFTPSHPHFSLQPLLWQSVLCRLQPASCRLQFNGPYIMYVMLSTSCFLCWDFSGPEAHGCWQKPTRRHTRATQQCVVVRAARPHLTNRARKAVGWCWPLALSERRALRRLSPRTLPKPNPAGPVLVANSLMHPPSCFSSFPVPTLLSFTLLHGITGQINLLPASFCLRCFSPPTRQNLRHSLHTLSSIEKPEPLILT